MLLCRVATEHDQADALQLSNSSGWQTLMAILESYGERPSNLKRSWPLDDDDDVQITGSRSSTPSDHLAKRFKQAASIRP